MRCKNCNANYKTKECYCPYCHTENMLGKIWKKQTDNALKDYANAQAEVNSYIYKYVINIILKRVLLGLLALIALWIIALIVAAALYSKDIDNRLNNPNSKYFKKMAKYWNEQDYMGLKDYMDDQNLYNDQKSYVYSQAALMYADYTDYVGAKYSFFELSKEEKTDAAVRTLNTLIRESNRLLTNERGLYSELAEENRPQWERYREDIRSFLMGYVGLTKEEMDLIEFTDYFDLRTATVDDLCDTLRERRAWENE